MPDLLHVLDRDMAWSLIEFGQGLNQIRYSSQVLAPVATIVAIRATTSERGASGVAGDHVAPPKAISTATVTRDRPEVAEAIDFLAGRVPGPAEFKVMNLGHDSDSYRGEPAPLRGRRTIIPSFPEGLKS
jgi:hypothetical protein